MSTAEILRDPGLLIVFTYAPAGLGHLRVTDALFHGLPQGSHALVLGADDELITFVHRVGSLSPFLRWLTERVQSGTAESLFTVFYRSLLRRRSKRTYVQINTLFNQQLNKFHTLLFISTHFNLAHQIASIKARLAQEKHVRCILVVQVTDDSPQKLWAVNGADLIVVPSYSTKTALVNYVKRIDPQPPEFIVVPYPVSESLRKKLTDVEFTQKKQQTNPALKTAIEVAIPISGAAVGFPFIVALTRALGHKKTRFHLHIVGKKTTYTNTFLAELSTVPQVSIVSADSDRAVVDAYDLLYQEKIIALEITKPSEQAFKALLSPKRRGGVVLLLTPPVGRQEYDNVAFLQRHQLLPAALEQYQLWEAAAANKPLNGNTLWDDLLNQWRALTLPENPEAAAKFIIWCLEQKISMRMMGASVHERANDKHADELAANGVEQFWDSVAEFLQKKSYA